MANLYLYEFTNDNLNTFLYAYRAHSRRIEGIEGEKPEDAANSAQYFIIEGLVGDNSDLDDNTLCILTEYYEIFKNTKTINISSNDISDNGIEHLCNLLTNTPDLETLNLSILGNVSFKIFVLIGNVLPSLRNLTELNLCSYKLFGLYLNSLREFISNADNRENVLTIHLSNEFKGGKSFYIAGEKHIKIIYH